MAYTTIKKPSDYFNTKLWTGNGSSQNITGLNFQPDFVWIKDRDDTSSHAITDAVRGNTKYLMSNGNYAEETLTDRITSFNSDGYSLGSSGGVNQNGAGNVGWNWLANGAGSANTDGDIASTVSANTTSGFSIVSYTGNSTSGATVGHGLGAVPKMIILKNRSASEHWMVGTTSLGWTKNLVLSLTNAVATDSSIWNNTTPTSSVFSVGNSGAVNTSSQNYIAYCFAEKQGYSKFGSYVGNGSADGTFVYTGFKPAFILSKDSSTAGENWFIQDTTRNTSNPVGAYLRPNLSDAEGTFSHYDILSNGFKNLYAGGSLNGSGKNIIYMAFAEQPLVGDNPATAR